MASNKVLTISNLKKEDAKNFNEKKVLNVNGYDFILDTHFRQSKIEEMLKDMVSKADELSSKYEDKDKKMKSFATIFSFLDYFIIKFFTNIYSELKDLDITQTLQVFEMLNDNDFKNPIIDYFNENYPNEVEKVGKLFVKFGEEMKKTTQELKDALDKNMESLEETNQENLESDNINDK
jgi:nitrate/nitrite-specific signal transduction histidine kinase